MTYVEIVGHTNGSAATSPWTQRIFRYSSNVLETTTVNFRERWGTEDLEPLGSGAVLGKGFDSPIESEEDDHSLVDDTGPDPIALVIVAPPKRVLGGLSRRPDDAKVWMAPDGDERLVYYWHLPEDQSISAGTAHKQTYRQRVTWQEIRPAHDLPREAVWARTPPSEVHPGEQALEHVTFPPEVIVELVKAHYPRRITAVDRDRAQAQLAMSGLTALVGVAFAAVSLNSRPETSTAAIVVSAVAVAAWLSTAVLAALALGQPETPYAPKHDVGRDQFIRDLLEHIGEEVAKARKGLRLAFYAAVLAVLATAVAVLLLLLDGRK